MSAPREYRDYVDDILQAITDIQQFIEGIDYA